jgi:N,N'-diacetyllegionaminate synthase
LIKIIAEAGVNHNGSLEDAQKLISAAKCAGADYIKFQTFCTDEVVLKTTKLADYQKTNLEDIDNQHDLLKLLELSRIDHIDLIKTCKNLDIQFLSTPFDVLSLNLLVQLGCQVIKISSGDLTNFFLLSALGRLNLQVILSTGMANLKEIQDAIECLVEYGTPKNKISILHCTSQYPCPISDANLKAIKLLKTQFRINVGFSDHTAEVLTPSIAVAYGATIIEKHITLDRRLPGPDQKASLEPLEFKEMVDLIRKTELAVGEEIKSATITEEKNKKTMRKSLVSRVKIRKGDIFTLDNLTAKRPGDGLSPMCAELLLGKRSDFDYEKDSQIKPQT